MTEEGYDIKTDVPFIPGRELSSDEEAARNKLFKEFTGGWFSPDPKEFDPNVMNRLSELGYLFKREENGKLEYRTRWAGLF